MTEEVEQGERRPAPASTPTALKVVVEFAGTVTGMPCAPLSSYENAVDEPVAAGGPLQSEVV